jgi:hypothetical protein
MSFFQWQVLFVTAMGAATGVIELIGRYRDAPFRALKTDGAFVYVLVNVVAALSGLFLLQTIGSNLIQEPDPLNRAIYQALLAGFGSLTFLRSSFFKIRVGDTDISVGPALLLDILLVAADRSVDRRRATERATQAVAIMQNVSFDKAINTLPPFCLNLMQNLTKDDQTSILNQVEAIQNIPAITPHVKSFLLGLLLMNFVGLDVLREAAEQLAPYIKYDVPQPKLSLEPSALTQMLEEVKRSIRREPAPEAQRQEVPPVSGDDAAKMKVS